MRQKHYSVTELLEANNCYIAPVTIFKVLIELGYIEEVEYLSSTGTGELKKYRRFTDKGLEYGINSKSFRQKSESTKCKFNGYNFKQLLAEVIEHLQTKKPKNIDSDSGIVIKINI